VHDELVYCKLALSNYTVYRHLKLICEEEMLYFCYLFAFFKYISLLGYCTLLTGKFAVVWKYRSAFILRVEPASQPSLVQIYRPLK
jgi:hypothetical protein